MEPSGPESTLDGKLIAVANRAEVIGVRVWFAYEPVDADGLTVETVSDENGEFSFDLPAAALTRATVGCHVEGASPVDLEPGGGVLEPGDVVIMIDDIVPSHLRFGAP